MSKKDVLLEKYVDKVMDVFGAELYLYSLNEVDSDFDKIGILESYKEDVYNIAIKKIFNQMKNFENSENEYVVYTKKMLIEVSPATKKAKKLGLVHLGFGRYGPEKGSSSTHKSVNGKLKKVKGTTNNEKSQSSKKDGNDNKVAKNDTIQNIVKISGEDDLYKYTYQGREKTIRLNKKEKAKMHKMNTSITQIIQDRIKDQKEKKEKDKLKQNVNK